MVLCARANNCFCDHRVPTLYYTEKSDKNVSEIRMESRSRASREQCAALLEFMESHGDITRPQQGPQGQIEADRLWQELVELLNSLGGGVIKPLDKWKIVWADWKTKIKKKALAICCEASDAGGGPSSRQTLTASEERVLGIMGLTAIIGLAGIEERGFDAPPSERNFLPPPTRDSVYTVCPSQISTTDEIMVDFIPSDSIQATTACNARPSLPATPSGELPRHPPPPVLTPPIGTVSTLMPSAMSPTTSTSRGASQRRRHRASPSPAASPTTSTPRRRGLFQTRTRRIQTPFEQATSEFMAVERRRLELEAEREKNDHERETERLRLKSRRIEMEENQSLILSRLAGTVDNLKEILPQLRLSSLPLTDIIP